MRDMEIVQRSSGYWIVDAQGAIEGAFIELSEAEERLSDIEIMKQIIEIDNVLKTFIGEVSND